MQPRWPESFEAIKMSETYTSTHSGKSQTCLKHLALCLCIWRNGQSATLAANCVDQLALAAHLQDLLQDKEHDEDVAHRVLRQVLFQHAHQLLHLRCRKRADRQANAHDDRTHGCAADELRGLEEVPKGLSSVCRLQAIAPQLIAGRGQDASRYYGGEHVHHSAKHGVRKGGVDGNKQGRHLVPRDAIDDVPQHCGRVGLVQIPRRHRQVHGLSESVVRDGQGDGAEDGSKGSPSESRRQVDALHDDVGRLKEGELDEVRGQGRVQVAPDLVGVQLFHCLPQGGAVHQHVVHQRLCHRTQRSRHHCPHRALRRGADHAAHEILLRHGAQNES